MSLAYIPCGVFTSHRVRLGCTSTYVSPSTAIHRVFETLVSVMLACAHESILPSRGRRLDTAFRRARYRSSRFSRSAPGPRLPRNDRYRDRRQRDARQDPADFFPRLRPARDEHSIPAVVRRNLGPAGISRLQPVRDSPKRSPTLPSDHRGNNANAIKRISSNAGHNAPAIPLLLCGAACQHAFLWLTRSPFPHLHHPHSGCCPLRMDWRTSRPCAARP